MRFNKSLPLVGHVCGIIKSQVEYFCSNAEGAASSWHIVDCQLPIADFEV